MAERFVTVAPSGGDYTSLSAAEAGEQADLVAAGDHLVIEIQGTWASADTAAVLIAGSTTSVTSYIEIRTDAPNRHAGVLNTSLYRLAPGSGSIPIRLQDNYTHLIGIQIIPTAANGVSSLTGSANSSCESCIVAGTATNAFLVSTSTSSGMTCRNCVAYGASTSGFSQTVGTALLDCYNCTAYDCETGFLQTTGTMTVRNCLAQANATADFSGTFGGSSNYNCDSDGGAGTPGANHFTDTASFVNAAGGDFHLSSALNQQGEDLTSVGVTTDFEGDPRSNWDVGADEIAAAPPAGGFVPRRALMGVGF